MNLSPRTLVLLIVLPLMLVLLVGCTRTVVVEKPVEVKIAVPQPCVGGDRPSQVIPLNQKIKPEDWKALDVPQKAAHVGRQGLDRQTFGEQLHAATAGCN